jgi:3-isopropylmalate dehydrogenase
MKSHIVLLPGDGIGPEIVHEARQVIEAVARKFGHDFTFETHLVGGISIDETGTPLTDQTLAACQAASAVLLGAVGGPKWDDPEAKTRPELGLLNLRRGLRAFANLRPIRSYPSLLENSPLKPERVVGVDMLVVRELTGGLYFGEPRFRENKNGVLRAVDTLEYTDHEIRRIVRMACTLARSRRRLITSVDKANILESSRLWRQVTSEVVAGYADIKLEHQLVDSAAMRLVTAPGSFDVVLTENMFGDILSDEAAVLTGSLGMLPSASLGDSGPGLYEPIHGSAPDIAGKGIANPLGTILSVALLLRHSLDLAEEAAAVERAVEAALASGARTKDLGGANPISTKAMGEAVLRELDH